MAESVLWNGSDLREAFSVSTDLMAANRATLDALNVFPVPDGDTGANMTLTMQGALDDARANSGTNPSVGTVAQCLAHGALLGARGNSGVILSQILRGFAQAIGDRDTINGRDIARGLRGASDAAYGAVMAPVEGTMLTVVRVAAEHAERSPSFDNSLTTVLEAALEGARMALLDTPNLLETLHEAGVVDSGGQGVVLLLQGLLAAARGTIPVLDELMIATVPNVVLTADEHDTYGYCTNFMIIGSDIPFEQVRADLAALGQSAVIVGDDAQVKVHIHTVDPGAALDYAIQWGSLSQIKIENMSQQVSRFEAHAAHREPDTLTVPGPAIVAVASGAGIVSAFKSSGVATVVDGGNDMDPGIDALRCAVQGVPESDVIVLPNSGITSRVAELLASLTDKNVRVIPTRSVAQGLAAASAFRPDRKLDDVVTAMRRAIDRVHTVEISGANKIRSSGSGIPGQYVASVDGRLQVASDNLLETTLSAITAAVNDKIELITIFTGVDVDEATSAELVERLSRDMADIEIEIVVGGQPRYQFIIAME